jgi:abortive infection bacteriophage resistance protein
VAAALIYSKPALPPTDLLRHLVDRGLTVEDRANALHALEYVGYYRLLIYMRAVQGPPAGTQPPPAEKWFNPGTTFAQILELYEFDRRLRLLCMDAIERVEVAVRSAINNRVATVLGPHFYEDPQHFRATFDHGVLLADFDRAKSLGITHYKNTYQMPARPPIWVALEASDFGALSRLVSGLLRTNQDLVAYPVFRLPAAVLVSWLRTMVTLRNICAHHGRLWNATLNANQPLRAHQYASHLAQGNTAYARLVVLAILLDAVDQNSQNWKQRLKHLFVDFPLVSPSQLGCPPGWETQPLWRE